MANGVWVYTQDLLGSGATALLQDCVAREIFDIYMNVGYPSPAQGTVTFPSLSGFVPDSEIGITCTSANVTTILATLASVDSRLKLWAWFGTWSSDNGGGDDALGHQNAKISINTPTRRSALITAIMTVANWGFYGIQDDTEDLNADSLEASGQYGATYITFTNDLATAAHAAGKKYIPFVPSVWYNFSNSFLQDLTVPDAIIMAGHNDSDIGQWNTLAQLFFDKAPRPVIYNFGWPAVAPTMTRLNSLPFSGVASKIVGYSWYMYYDWQGNWGTWDSWRASHPSVASNRTYEIGGGGGGGSAYVWDGKKLPDSMRDAATAAASVAANGSKNAAFRTSIKNAIGNGFRRKLFRDGTLVWEATDTGYLPESGNAFVLDLTVTQVSISNADIDSGVWIHKIEHLTDSTKFIATLVTPVGGGGAMTLSGDLVAGGQLTLTALTLNCPSFDTGSPGVPGGGTSITIPSAGQISGAEAIWNDWTEMTQGNDQMLLVTAGSPLDMSWVFSSSQSSAFGGERLLGWNMAGWNWPDAGAMPTYVNHIKRTGAKIVRYMSAGVTWGGGTMYSKIGDPNDDFGCDHNPSGIATMKRFFAKISDAGIKYAISIRWQGNDFRRGVTDFWSNYPTAEDNASFLFQVGDTRGVRNWQACFDVLFLGTVNDFAVPKALVADTNLICIDIINENNLENANSIAPGGAAALSNRYWNSWRAANGNKPFMEYIHTMHKTMVESARTYAAANGYATTRKLSSNNYIPDLISSVLRAEELNITDIHLYQDLSDSGGLDGDLFTNQSVIGCNGFGFAQLFPYFVWDQTSMTTEWGMGSHNQYGYEFCIYGAYWSMQGGNWITQFMFGINTLSATDWNVWGENFAAQFRAHDATKDAAGMAAFRAAVFMFQRKDVTESTTSLGLVVRKSLILNNGEGYYGRWPENIVLLANFLKVRLVKESDVNGSLAWVGSGSGPTKIIDPLNDSTAWNRSMADWITWLKNEGLITNDNTSDAAIGRYESGTKEIRITRDHKSGRVKTAKTHMVIWDNPTLVDNTDLLVIESATPKGMVSLHDIGTDTPGIATTNKLLLIHATMSRGKNTGNNNPTSVVYRWDVQSFQKDYASVPGYAIQDSSGNYGYRNTTVPVKIRGSIVVVKVKAALGTWTIYRLDIRGNRVGSVPYEWTNDDYLRFVLDNTSGAALMQTTYYELVKVDSATTNYTLGYAYSTAMTSLNDFPPGNLQSTSWPSSLAFPTSPWGSNVDQMVTAGSSPVGAQEGTIVSRGANRFLLFCWFMPPKNELTPTGNWRIQFRDVQVAAKVDALTNPWNLFFGPTNPNPGYGNNNLGGLRLSGNITNSANTNLITLHDMNQNPMEARAEVSGGVSLKNVGTSTNLFQVEVNVPDGGSPHSDLPASVTDTRTKAFAAVYWARLIPDTGSGPLPSGITVGGMLGVDFYGPSGRLGNPGWSRIVQLDGNWKPVVMAFALDPNNPNQPMSPSALGAWLAANPPPFS